MLIQFLKNIYNNSNAEEGYFELLQFFRNIALKFLNYNDEQLLSLYHDFLISKILENSTFQNFLKRADDKEIILYLRKIIRNFLINDYKKNYEENKLLSLNTKLENSKKELIDDLKDERLLIDIKIDALFLLEIINKSFSKREQKLLCIYLSPEKYQFLYITTNNAKYKAIQRIKTKMEKIIHAKNISEEAADFFFKEIYLSEICDKFC